MIVARGNLSVVVVVVAGALALVGAPGSAAAEPVMVGGQAWDHTADPQHEIFTRADGTRVVFAAAGAPCPAADAHAPRPPGVPLTYWPTVIAAGDRLTLCLETGRGPAAIEVTGAGGKPVAADVAPMLQAIVDEARPAVEVPGLGPIRPSIPVALARGTVLSFQVGAAVAGLGLEYVDHGTCAYENALVGVKVGQAANRTFAAGYWPTVFDSDSARYGCLDLREGYVALFVNPLGQADALADVLAELRRAAYAAHGAPLATEAGAVSLPHVGRALTVTSTATWKIVDGGPFKAPGADALVSTSPLGEASTMYSIVVSAGCAGGTAAAPADVTTSLFPWATGPAWIDPDPIKLRWKAWTCVRDGAGEAAIAVAASLAHDAAPEPRDQVILRPALDAVAAAYGVHLALPPPPPPDRGNHRGKPLGLASVYLGVLALAPDGGDLDWGGLVGFEMRLRSSGAGFAGAFDAELGHGGGEFLGELRFGGGLSLGSLEAVVGLGLGSTGPAAATDFYGQLAGSFGHGRQMLWLGALHAIGVGGPDHDQLDARLVITGRDETGLFLGARALWFGPDGDTGVDNGRAFLVTVGSGAASNR